MKRFTAVAGAVLAFGLLSAAAAPVAGADECYNPGSLSAVIHDNHEVVPGPLEPAVHDAEQEMCERGL